MEHIPLFAAFGAGLASFLSPCVVPLVPVYLASVAGPGVLEVGSRQRRIPVFLHSLSFVVGFSIIFVIIGAAAGLAGFAISPYSVVVRRVVGSLLIVFGLFMLAALKVPWLNYEKRLRPSLGTTAGYLRSFLTGSVFSLAWTACVGPILAGILTLAMDSATIWRGANLLAVYSLGLGLPFLITGVAFDAISPLLKRIYRYTNIIYIASGLLLIAMGGVVLANKLTWFATLAG